MQRALDVEKSRYAHTTRKAVSHRRLRWWLKILGPPWTLNEGDLVVADRQEALEVAATGRMAHLLQRLRLDLADTLACHLELAAEFLERAAVAVDQAETQFQH